MINKATLINFKYENFFHFASKIVNCLSQFADINSGTWNVSEVPSRFFNL